MTTPRKCVERSHFALARWIAIALAVSTPYTCFAQTDEIQVYDGTVVGKGHASLMLHNNFTPKGARTPEFAGGIVSNHAYVGVAEWAYGVTDWFEQGLYLPLYSYSTNQGLTYNGFKLRWLFAVPHAEDRKFFYAVNFEFSVNDKHWDTRHFTSEIRPIIGVHLKPSQGAHWKPIDLIFNPIMDTSYVGGPKSLEFAPGVRAAYNFTDKWSGAIEEYSGYGPFRQFGALKDQSHQIYGVVDHSAKGFDFEFGVGVGLTAASDKVTIKLMIAHDLK